VSVEPKVFDLLLHLLEQRGRCLSHRELLEAVWPGTVVAPAALTRAIKEARRAVGDDGTRQAIIATVHRRGYRFVASARERSPSAEPPTGVGAQLESAGSSVESTASHVYSGELERSSEILAVAWVFPRFAGCSPLPRSGTLVLGRGEENDFVLADNDVSRRHAEIFRDGPTFAIRDLRSRNGTFLNANRIEQTAIAPGDVIRLGDVIGVVTHILDGEANEPRELAPGLIGSATLDRVLRPLRRVAQEGTPLVLIGENGTGKHRIARALHDSSGRRGPFRVVNCAVLAETDGSSASFGDDEPGAPAEKANGTLLLRDVTMLPLAAQARLLERLERDDSTWLVVSSEESLVAAVERGTLRADLYMRLQGTLAAVPPLRDRIGDVPALFFHFAGLHGGGRAHTASPSLVERLCLYDWPYNVRELETSVQQLLIDHASEQRLRSSHLPPHVARRAGRFR
jgi:DNA-binding winged helix-turn-helix (wHTH) protein